MADITRRAGLLLHPSSLPGPYGIGEIGSAARELLAWAEAARLRVWQMLPLTPVGPHGSPYSSPSSEAREPLLLAIDDLVADGWLLSKERPHPSPARAVDWDTIGARRGPALIAAADRVRAQVDLDDVGSAEWVEEWALFQALREEHGEDWVQWPEGLRDRDAHALAAFVDQRRDAIDRHRALQWLFDQQWARLRAEAKARGIELWGDLPFFVGLQSNDVWAHPHLWRLDGQRVPTVLSGVPPDAFSDKGQLWGHPLYDEEAHRAEGHAWWLRRVEANLSLVDRLRVDHFRGFAGVWEVPQGAEDAIGGRWIPGPGSPLLEALRARWPALPFIAEDLGVITDDVRELQAAHGLPGMAILQFAFGAEGDAWDNPYLPHHHVQNQVVYTGTHDNDTTLGWFRALAEPERDRVRRYLSVSDRDFPFALVRAALRSVAETAILPMQDFLALGSEARTNVPGRAVGNWAWRAGPEAFNLPLARIVAEQVEVSGR